jgi:hypothetical protein
MTPAISQYAASLRGGHISATTHFRLTVSADGSKQKESASRDGILRSLLRRSAKESGGEERPGQPIR